MYHKPRPPQTVCTSTLIFATAKPYRDEHPCNYAAACLTSPVNRICHVEISIGSAAGKNNTISNVFRIFSGEHVEEENRTGLNPSLMYVEVTTTKPQQDKMLAYARSVVGRPFSSSAMARAVCWPRKTHEKDFFCAELVACILRSANLYPRNLNPGSATPESIYRLACNGQGGLLNGQATGNPSTLRQLETGQLNFRSTNWCTAPPREAPGPLVAPMSILDRGTRPFSYARIERYPESVQPRVIQRDACHFLRTALRNSCVIEGVQEKDRELKHMFDSAFN